MIGFHLLTGLLFPIGIFPWLMIASSTIFFEPDWPERLRNAVARRFASLAPLLDRMRREPSMADEAVRARLPLAVVALAGLFFAVQLALPLRYLVYPGPPSWTDEGFRFAWRVMLVDKAGSVRFDVVERASSRRYSVDPRAYLTPFQTQMMAQSPDMVLELAQHVAGDFRRRKGLDVAVHADAWASLNGRAPKRLIDPNVDLSREADGLRPARFVLPLD